MAAISIPARSEQTHFPITQKEARRAARLWFTGSPVLSLAEWRDARRLAHCDGLPRIAERTSAFNTAFAHEVGAIIASGGLSNE